MSPPPTRLPSTTDDLPSLSPLAFCGETAPTASSTASASTTGIDLVIDLTGEPPSGPDSDPAAETRVELEAEAEPDVDAEVHVEIGAEADPQPEPEHEPEVDAEAHVGAGQSSSLFDPTTGSRDTSGWDQPPPIPEERTGAAGFLIDALGGVDHPAPIWRRRRFWTLMACWVFALSPIIAWLIGG